MTAYDVDYLKWKAEQTELLKRRRFKELDIEHLIEELEMGDPRRELVSDLTILIAHLLKLDIQSDAPDWMKASWYSSIDEHRNRVNEAIKTSGTLRNYLDEELPKLILKREDWRLKRVNGPMVEKSVFPMNRNILKNFLLNGG